jgi:hypothetical protein
VEVRLQKYEIGRMRYSVIGGLCPAAKLKILGLGLL